MTRVLQGILFVTGGLLCFGSGYLVSSYRQARLVEIVSNTELITGARWKLLLLERIEAGSPEEAARYAREGLRIDATLLLGLQREGRLGPDEERLVIRVEEHLRGKGRQPGQPGQPAQ